MINMSSGIIFENNEVSDLLTGKIPLNEVYFGKTKELLAAEQQLDKFRNKYIGRYVINMRVNSDPDLLEFDRMIEKIFGFGCFTMHIHNEATCNAFTLPIDYRYDYANPSTNTIADERGFKFKTQYDYACIVGIYSGLIFNPNFTTPEIMAFVLHEIGHNFNSSINRPNGILLNVYTTIVYLIGIVWVLTPQTLIRTITNTNDYRKFVDKAGKSMREYNSMPVVVYDVFIQAMAIVKQCRGVIFDAIRVLTLGTFTTALAVLSGVTQILKNPLSIVYKTIGLKLGYATEESADNFVSMYGYSSELASGLAKMGGKEGSSSSTVMGVFDNIPIISTIMHFNEAPAYLILSLMDEHPNDVSRVKDQINMLKRELDKEDIDPKMAKYIKSDIEACEAALNVLVDCSAGINDPYLCKKVYNKMASHGNDVKRKLVGNKHKFEEYDKAFKRASE